jgi:biopolymer transport protein TolQ
VINQLLLQTAPNRFAGDLWGLVLASDPLAQVILIILFIFSLFSWAIILRKHLTFKKVEKESKQFIEYFRKSSKLSEVQSITGQFNYSPLPSIFLSGFKELNTQIKIAASRSKAVESENEQGPKFAIRSLEGIHRALQRAAAAELTGYYRLRHPIHRPAGHRARNYRSFPWFGN